MDEKGSQQFASQINQAPCHLPGEAGNCPKDNLFHRIVRTDIEHIDEAFRMEKKVQAGGSSGQQKKKNCRKKEVLWTTAVSLRKYQKESQKDQKEMPEVAVQGKKRQGIVHTAGICKGKEPSEKSEVCQKICQKQADFLVFFRKQTIKGQQIHRHAAELEGKIPPVIGTAVADIQKDLFSSLRERQQDRKENQQIFLTTFRQSA